MSLLVPRVVNMPDGEVFIIISNGSVQRPAPTTGTLAIKPAISPRLDGTMTPFERWQAVSYMRAVQAGEITQFPELAPGLLGTSTTMRAILGPTYFSTMQKAL